MWSIPTADANTFGKATQNAGTVITRLVPPVLGAYTRIVEMWYTCGSTAHTVTVMRPLGKTTASAAAAASQAVINITADPGVYSTYGTISVADNAIAGSDFVVYQTKDGLYVVDTVSSVSTLAITLTNNVPTATVAKGAPFWFFGVTTDTNPATNQAHFQLNAPANVTSYWPTAGSVEVVGSRKGLQGPKQGTSLTSQWPLDGRQEPLIVHSNNATAAGTIEFVSAVYTTK